MADEPKRPIEQELESWAQQRRAEAGAPFELDPVQRRQLQEEVERVQAAGPVAPPRPLWWLLLPRLALGGALAGLLLLAVVHMGSHPQPATTFELARQDKAADLAAVNDASVTPEPPAAMLAPTAETDAMAPMQAANQPAAATPAVAEVSAPEAAPVPRAKAEVRDALKQDSVTAEKRQRVASTEAAVASAPRPVAARSEPRPEPTDVPAVSAPALRERYGVSVGAAAKRPTGSAAVDLAGGASVGRMNESGLGTANRLGQFAPAQRLRRNFNSPPQRVLAQFALEQDGEAVRVVDRDGSVYAGQTLPANRVEETSELSTSRTRAAAATKPPGAAGFSFEVRGTNVTTGELVVMRGVFRSQPAPSVEASAEVGTQSRLQILAPRLPEPGRGP